MSTEYTSGSPDFALGVFSDQAYNLILLAEDEARMLGHRAVEPEHVLLALARDGNVETLLRGANVGAGDIYRAIVGAGGLGDDLVIGRIPRSRATDAALRRAVAVAASRGVLGPSSEHVLLGLGHEARVRIILDQVGIADSDSLVDQAYPGTLPPPSAEHVESYVARTRLRPRPRPGPIPPAFERFTIEAQQAIAAAQQHAAALGDECVAAWHFVLGASNVERSVAATVLLDYGITPATLTERAQRAHREQDSPATGIFTDEARRVVAEDALKYAYRHDHRSIGTGHVLLATLDALDGASPLLLRTGAVAEHIAREVIRRLPGAEEAAT